MTTYEITRITPLSEPQVWASGGSATLAYFDVTFGPLTLKGCGLTHSEGHGYGMSMPSRHVKMRPELRNQIKAQAKAAYLAMRPAAGTLTTGPE